MRRVFAFCFILLLVLSGCSGRGFDVSREIDVITREEGSGTRGAFVELFGLLQKGEDGTRTDLVTKEAGVENNTNTILTTVRGDESAIGYISMGALDGKVKALAIDGVAATTENVVSGDYTVSRPFIVVTAANPSALAEDFIAFILSRDGQAIAAKSYIAVAPQAPPYSGDAPAGKLVVGGSSSVSPLMEKLIEAYEAANPNANVQLQTTDSTMGVSKTIEGAYDVGMVSRDLKLTESGVLTDTVIALDGIALIVSPENPVSELTREDIRRIYTGEAATWAEVTR
ncbi:MAG: substrate-binding domain-containing protein [Oscillospiraceae bacterium]|jgi:phosphate transport system substrate-binding protein|nr:substrate-binding domain-containing protein [Oscillospiraceae bacterium]